jgi:hypothetical protein
MPDRYSQGKGGKEPGGPTSIPTDHEMSEVVRQDLLQNYSRFYSQGSEVGSNGRFGAYSEPRLWRALRYRLGS